MQWTPSITLSSPAGEPETISLGHPVVDDYLTFVGARARRNTWLATAYDLKVFFSLVAKDPADITTADVFAFIKSQRTSRINGKVVRLEDGEVGLAARTIKRRLSTLSGLFAYLVARGDVGIEKNPVPRGLATRKSALRSGVNGVPLLRSPRTLPRVLSPEEVDMLRAALRTGRDRAMVDAMVLGGLRRCEVLGLRLNDLNPGEKRLHIREAKGGHERIVPIAAGFFVTLRFYLNQERPETDHDVVFVVLKGPRRGQPLSAAGVDEVIEGARHRAGLARATCHQLRHTCFTRLREAGMKLEALQAQAGHRSIESTRLYLHLANDWLEREYLRAVEVLETEAIGAQQ